MIGAGLPKKCDVAIIGAGPAGAVAGALLGRAGVDVVIVEKETFPRFVIGESLLPQCMSILERCGALAAVQNGGFQRKNGAMFEFNGTRNSIDFADSFTDGWTETFQVRRAEFDKILADHAVTTGASVHYGRSVAAMDQSSNGWDLTVVDVAGHADTLACRFVLDASGYGRVLSRLFSLDQPSNFPMRRAVFSHLTDRIDDPEFDREKIVIATHPKQTDIWYWLIPFSDGTCSIGAVGKTEAMERLGETPAARLKQAIAENTCLAGWLENASERRAPAKIAGYSMGIRQLVGPGYAILGNAGEFLDPIFSSGVTIALKSADLAVDPVLDHLAGKPVDWEGRFTLPLQKGVDVFRTFVEGWYDGSLRQIIFNRPENNTEIGRMIIGVLAGYAWDHKNPFVQDPERCLRLVLAQCE